MKQIKVKDWFANKVLNENKVKMYGCASVYAIFKETEKAVYCMMCDACSYVLTWVPKSCLEEGGRYVTYPAGYENGGHVMDVRMAVTFWNSERD